ncbi:MAG: AAA family ATPase [Candidatus Woesearchaeota archaeon]
MAVKKVVITSGSESDSDQIFCRLDKMHYFLLRYVSSYALSGIPFEGSIMQHTNRNELQLKIIQTQLKWERSIPEQVRVAFLDSGSYDPLAYYILKGVPLPSALMSAAEKNHYDHVFVLTPLTSTNGLTDISKALFDVYRCYGHEPIAISAPSIDARLRTILDLADPNREMLTTYRKEVVKEQIANGK